jgi:2-methylcitrate dehydratase PrpD
MRDAIGGAHGFFKMYCGDPKPEVLVKDLGKVFYADVVVKPYAACRATHPSITACEEIRSNNDFEPGDIKKITIRATPRTCAGFVGQAFELGETPQVSGAFSIRFTAANMLLRGRVRPEDFTREKMEEPELQDLLSKVDLVPELDPKEYLTSEVLVTLKDGTELFYRAEVPKGDIYKNPISYEQIIDKYYQNIAFSGRVSRDNANKALRIVEDIENLDTIRDLVELFV